MKTAITFVVTVILISMSLYAQNSEPAQIKFKVFGDSVLFNSNNPPYKSDKFTIGWHWINGKTMSRAVLANTMNPDNGVKSFELVDSALLVMRPDFIGINGADQTSYMQSQMMQYEPALLVGNNQHKRARIGDNSNPIFGFRNIRGYISNNLSDPNFSRLMLYKDSLNNQIVLSDNCPPNGLYSITGFYGNNNDSLVNIHYFLSLNMRRLNFANPIADDSVILALRLKYSAAHDTIFRVWNYKEYPNDTTQKRDSTAIMRNNGYIKFSKIPSSIINDVDYIPLGRGIARRTTVIYDTCTEIKITRKMLPIDINNKDITISSLFYCDNLLNHNPFLCNNPSNIRAKIDSFLIEVKYLGRESVGLDWIRLECERGQDLERGKGDSIIRFYVQKMLDTVCKPDFAAKGVRPFRIYLRDESGYSFWEAFRYFQKLVGNIATTAVGSYWPGEDLYDYHVGFPDRWREIGMISSNIANPYYKYGMEGWPCFGLKMGYAGYMIDTTNYKDTTHSQYETFNWFVVCGDGWSYWAHQPLPFYIDCSIQDYENMLGRTGSFQGYVESTIYGQFYQSHNYWLLFSKKNWWAQTFVGNKWCVDEINHQVFTDACNRPKTGEEIRQMQWLALCLGAKGFMYDRSQQVSNPYDYGLGHGQGYYDAHGLDTIPPDEFLERDDIGSDFFNRNTEYSGIQNYIPYDVVTYNLNTTPDRIYTGRKSVRTELARLHKYIKNPAVEPVLMNLDLVAWRSKGFKILGAQDSSYYPPNIFNKYILVDSIKTRPIDRTKYVKIDSHMCHVPYYENEFIEYGKTVDSGFYLISLHKEKNKGMDSVYYISCVNRRTDPLVFWSDTVGGIPCQYLRFLSTAEFNDSCRYSRDSLRFQSYFWKRLGCREITIGMNINPDTSNHRKYRLLHISELGAKDTNLKKQYWRNPKYYHLVDTIIGQDKNLVVKLLPGEGKMLKVEVLPPAQDINGELDFSNQRKFIGHPIRNVDNVLIRDSLYYHLVYHRVNQVNNTSRIFYRRSKPVNYSSNESNYANIVWDIEMPLSDCIKLEDNNYEIQKPTNCKYPSIVVRYDSTSAKNKVYIVYACEGREGPPEPVACPNNYLFIVENIFNADDPVQAIPPARVIYRTCGTDYEAWGNTMINASGNNGNYYVWNDSLKGIQTAWKCADTSQFAPNFNFTASSFRCFPMQTAAHPSLNTYSRLQFNEPDCALVWQEKPPGYGTWNKVYYSLLSVNSTKDVVRHHLYPNIRTHYPGYVYSQDTTIMQISNYPKDNRMPVVFRTEEVYNEDDSTRLYDIFTYESGDTIVNCDNSGMVTSKYFLTSQTFRWANLTDTSAGVHWFQNPSRIMTLASTSLQNPNLAQGTRYEEDSYWNNPVKSVVLEFTERNYCTDGSDPDLTSSIWTYPHHYDYFSIIPYNYIENNHWDSIHTNAKRIHSNASLPQQAAIHGLSGWQDWRKNRRVFKTDSTIADIVTSSKEYYRGNRPEKTAIPFYGFADTLESSFISLMRLNGMEIQFDIKDLYSYKCDSCILPPVFIGKDTIKSKWFSVGSNAGFEYSCLGFDNNNFKIVLEKKITGNRINLNAGQVNRQKLMRFGFNLVNGQNDEYRLLFINNNPSYRFMENIVLIHDLNEQYGLEKQSSNISAIDLGAMAENTNNTDDIVLSVYPNPADNVLYTTATMPIASISKSVKQENIIIKIYSNFGKVVFTKEVPAGETISIATDNLSQGVYFIQAEEKNKTFITPLAPVMQSFVIER